MAIKNYDSEFCGSVPLNKINLIQAHGILMVLSKETLHIGQVSENVETVLGYKPADIVDKPMQKFLPEEQFAELAQLASKGIKEKVPQLLTLLGKDGVSSDYLANMHIKGESLILELEKMSGQMRANLFVSMQQQQKMAFSAIQSASTLEESCRIAVEQVKNILGFDKVMIYRFDENWNGNVIAEVKVEDMESYLNLTFPASDIPKQARAMYQNNPYRIIANREYEPVGIYPVINPHSHAYVDLSETDLRGVAAVHLEYMKNMNIMASVSCRILHNGKLWGLISCHHKTPKYLAYDSRTLLELLSNIISNKIASLIMQEQNESNHTLNNLFLQLIEQVYNNDDLIDGLSSSSSNILQLLRASGAVIVYNRQKKLLGTTPGTTEVADLLLWLQGNETNEVYQIFNLPEVYDPATAFFKEASGILVIPIKRSKGEFIVAFRPEVVQEVNWGGNPEDAIKFEKDNIQYHPRNSFKIWQQTVRQTAVPWTQEDFSIAGRLRNFIMEYTIRLLS